MINKLIACRQRIFYLHKLSMNILALKLPLPVSGITVRKTRIFNPPLEGASGAPPAGSLQKCKWIKGCSLSTEERRPLSFCP